MPSADSAGTNSHLVFLSQLLLRPKSAEPIGASDMDDCLDLAHKNHVIVRGSQVLLNARLGLTPEVMERAATALAAEQSRIENALPLLECICRELERGGCDATVIKSLDHWPDLGSDLDLYSNGASKDVIHIMQTSFHAELAERSWGDRLAGKWNFIIPGLPESVEIHIGRLGQTGEHVEWANSIPQRAVCVQRGQYSFRTASPEDRIMISTLQRMYRHFYFRLCDIVDSSLLLETQGLDFTRLRDFSQSAGIWKGVSTYLAIVSDYVKCYRGHGVELPAFVRDASVFGGEQLSFRRDFLRVPLVPQSVALYTSQLTTLVLNGDVRETFRLSLLPYLAAAAAVGQKLTGSDKGIW